MSEVGEKLSGASHPSLDLVRFTDSELVEARLDVIKADIIEPLAANQFAPAKLNAMQVRAARSMIDLAPDQVIHLPVRTGKSAMIAFMADLSRRMGIQTVILAPQLHILNSYGLELTRLAGIPAPEIKEEPDENPPEGQFKPKLVTLQKIARNNTPEDDVDQADLVLIDEGHKALGKATVQGIREAYPNAVRICFTATPDYPNSRRSATDEYGEKVISKRTIDAIRAGLTPPVRAFLYKTEGSIDFLDPKLKDFTPRELRRIANLVSRNKAIVDIAQDLVAEGRQGLITTIPGENLKHADLVREELAKRTIVDADGNERPIRARVVRGSDKDLTQALEDFELGQYDILLYCNVIRESYTSHVASFLLHGSPSTSEVNVTQDVGRILQPKDGEMIVVDFLDDSVKKQYTIFDVLEVDQVEQGYLAHEGQKPASRAADEEDGINNSRLRDTYIRGLFRPEVVRCLQDLENKLISDVLHPPEPVETEGAENLYQKRLNQYRHDQAKELSRQQRYWEARLKKSGLTPDPTPDLFMIPEDRIDHDRDMTEDGELRLKRTLVGPNNDFSPKRTDSGIWPGFEEVEVILPPIPIPNQVIEWLHPISAGHLNGMTDLEVDVKQALVGTLKALSVRELELVTMRFGFDGRGERTLEEIAVEFGVSRERIRQIEAKVVGKLRGLIYDKRGDFSAKSKPIEPSPDEVRAYHEYVMGRLKLPDSLGIEPTAKQIVRHLYLNETRRIKRERDRYIKLLGGLYFEHTPSSDMKFGAIKIIDAIATELGFPNQYDYESRSKIAEELARFVDKPSFMKAIKSLKLAMSYIEPHVWDEKICMHVSRSQAEIAVIREQRQKNLQQIIDDFVCRYKEQSGNQ